MTSETITIKRTVTLNLSFNDFKKIVKKEKLPKEDMEEIWKLLKKTPDLGYLVYLYGSMADKDEVDEIYKKSIKKELKTITLECLKYGSKNDSQEEED